MGQVLCTHLQNEPNSIHCLQCCHKNWHRFYRCCSDRQLPNSDTIQLYLWVHFHRDEQGNDITDLSVSKEYYDKVEGRVEEYIEARKEKKLPDIPARVGLQLMGWKAKRPIEEVVEYFNLDFEFAKRPELVSFHQLFERGEDYFVSDQRGFWSMFEDLYKPLTNKILLNKTVTEIKYSETSVEVSTSDGEKFAADYALCTFSNGVLASDVVTFNPPLSEWKKEVIFKDPMSVYTTIFLKFPSKFWDDHEYILHASKERGRFPIFQDLDRPGILPNGSGVLLIVLTEDEGKRIERQPYNETKAEVMKMLRKIYGQGIPDATGNGLIAYSFILVQYTLTITCTIYFLAFQ